MLNKYYKAKNSKAKIKTNESEITELCEVSVEIPVVVDWPVPVPVPVPEVPLPVPEVVPVVTAAGSRL